MKERNNSLDVTRGIAAIIVLLGHTLQVYTDAESNYLFKMITCLQMPLFMFVSGYAIGYSKSIESLSNLYDFLKKRSLSLLLPWFMWSIIVYFVMINKSILEHIRYAAYHMESAFWFLFSLWTISSIFAFASFVANKYCKRNRIFLTITFVCIFNIVLLLIGMKLGMSFLGIKYSLYYMLFYMLGWLIHKYDCKNVNWRNSKQSQIVFIIAILIFGVFYSKFSVVLLPDNYLYILVRGLISIAGCFIIYYFCFSYKLSNNIGKYLEKFGTISLELYVVQYVLINSFVKPYNLSIQSTEGLVNWGGYTIIVFLLCLVVIKILSSTATSRLLFFGKK